MQVFGSYEETALPTYNAYINHFGLEDIHRDVVEALNNTINQTESVKMFENVSILEIVKSNMPGSLKITFNVSETQKSGQRQMEIKIKIINL